MIQTMIFFVVTSQTTHYILEGHIELVTFAFETPAHSASYIVTVDVGHTIIFHHPAPLLSNSIEIRGETVSNFNGLFYQQDKLVISHTVIQYRTKTIIDSNFLGYYIKQLECEVVSLNMPQITISGKNQMVRTLISALIQNLNLKLQTSQIDGAFSCISAQTMKVALASIVINMNTTKLQLFTLFSADDLQLISNQVDGVFNLGFHNEGTFSLFSQRQKLNCNIRDLNVSSNIAITQSSATYGLLFATVDVESLSVTDLKIVGVFDLLCKAGFLIYEMKGEGPKLTNVEIDSISVVTNSPIFGFVSAVSSTNTGELVVNNLYITTELTLSAALLQTFGLIIGGSKYPKYSVTWLKFTKSLIQSNFIQNILDPRTSSFGIVFGKSNGGSGIIQNVVIDARGPFLYQVSSDNSSQTINAQLQHDLSTVTNPLISFDDSKGDTYSTIPGLAFVTQSEVQYNSSRIQFKMSQMPGGATTALFRELVCLYINIEMIGSQTGSNKGMILKVNSVTTLALYNCIMDVEIQGNYARALLGWNTPYPYSTFNCTFKVVFDSTMFKSMFYFYENPLPKAADAAFKNCSLSVNGQQRFEKFGIFGATNTGSAVELINSSVIADLQLTGTFGVFTMQLDNQNYQATRKFIVSHSILTINVDSSLSGANTYNSLILSQGPFAVFHINDVELFGTSTMNCDQFGVLGNGGTGTIDLKIANFNVQAEYFLPSANSIGFIWNQFTYDSGSTIYVQNMLFGGNISAKDMWTLYAITPKLSDDYKYQFVNYSHFSKMKFDYGSMHPEFMYYKLFENVTSSNIDKGQIGSNPFYFANIIPQHSNSDILQHFKVAIDYFDIGSGLYADKDGFSMLNSHVDWNNVDFNITTMGQPGAMISLFKDGHQTYAIHNMVIFETVQSTANQGAVLFRQTSQTLSLTNVDITLKATITGNNRWGVVSVNLNFAFTMENCKFDVTTIFSNELCRDFSFVSLEPTDQNIAASTCTFEWTKEGFYVSGSPVFGQGIFSAQYKGSSIAVSDIKIRAVVTYGYFLGFISARLLTFATIQVTNIALDVNLHQTGFGQCTAMIVGQVDNGIDLTINGFSIVGEAQITNNAASMIMGYVEGTISGSIRNSNYGDKQETYRACVIGGKGGTTITLDYQDESNTACPGGLPLVK